MAGEQGIQRRMAIESRRLLKEAKEDRKAEKEKIDAARRQAQEVRVMSSTLVCVHVCVVVCVSVFVEEKRDRRDGKLRRCV
jgi:hypothetical protein